MPLPEQDMDSRARSGDDPTDELLLRLLGDGSRAQLRIIHETCTAVLPSVDPSQYGALRRIQRCVRELGTLVSDVTEFHAYLTGGLSEAESDFDLRVTLEGIQTRLSGLGTPDGAAAIVRVRNDVPPLLRGKPARLQDIVLGAATATFDVESPPALCIDVTKGWDRGDAVELVFQCYKRWPHPIGSGERGSFRNGLASRSSARPLLPEHLRPQLARRLAVTCGGSIEMLAPDDPTIAGFELRLPCGVRSVPKVSSVEKTPATLRGRRALIVDASEARRSRTSSMLRLWGMQAEASSNSRGALESIRDAIARETPFEFVLIDAELEDTDGAVLGRLIGADIPAQRPRLMLMYGVGMRGDAALAEQIGFDAYLPREISTHELREALLVVLGRAQISAPRAPVVTKHLLADVRREGFQVLLVSGDPVGALVLEAVLRRKGLQVDRVPELTGAAERCEKTPYDFLILDLGQPSAGDLALAGALRALADEHGPTPLVALVEAGVSAENTDFTGLSPEAVFAKPVDLERICQFCEASLHAELSASPTRTRSQSENVVCVGGKQTDDESVVFDRERLVESTMGIESLQLSVLESYLEEMPRRVEAIAAALSAGEIVAAEPEILGARAMARAIGAFGTARHLGVIWEHVAAGKPAQSIPLIGRLRDEVEQSVIVLREARAALIESMVSAA
jgi:CheY-like chemotaxis protein